LLGFPFGKYPLSANARVNNLPHTRIALTIQIAPAIREHCEKTQCVEPAKHFQHCAEKVEGGKGWQGEDCVEELFHLMHCVDVSTLFSAPLKSKYG
jgi:ubiquinol-cytochrome c reductase subunit 6